MANPEFSRLAELKTVLVDGAPDVQSLAIAADHEPFALPLQEGSGAFWQRLRITLYGFIYAIGDEKETDEPEFITLASVDRLTVPHHTPDVVEPPEVAAWLAQYPRTPVVEHHYLNDGAEHAVAVSCAAFDSDQDSAWESFVKALQLDIRNVGGATISRFAPGLVSPGHLLDFLGAKLGGLLTDSSEVIGSEKVIIDRSERWERPPHMTRWRGGKWAVFHRRDQQAWYLTLWTAELDAGPNATRTAVPPPQPPALQPPAPLPPPPPSREHERKLKPEFARQYLSSSPLDVAALRVLRGDSAEEVGEALGIAPARIGRHLRWLETDTAGSFDLRIRAALIEEVETLRRRVDERGQRD